MRKFNLTKKQFPTLLLGLGLFLLESPALACMGAELETITFLDRLPKEAMKTSVVAKIKVISSTTEKIQIKLENKTEEIDAKIVAEVKVLEALKGTKKGALMKVVIELSSCSHEPKIAAGQEYYLAGSIEDGVFRGEWRRHSLRP
jgi:hypothetical protein